jgi:hypothetical protein
MKRFWLVLLSLGLITAFSTQALAVDLKFSGEYFAAGMYLDRVGVNETTYGDPNDPDGLNADTHTAFYYQRLRLTTTFVVHPGLFFITRADIMERAWAAPRFNPGAGGPGALDDRSAGTRAENENIAFDLAYVQYVSPIGIFLAGYQIDGAWGTTFGDTSMPTPKIGYLLPIKGFLFGLQTGKNPDGERSWGRWNGSFQDGSTDRDNNFYTAFVKYTAKGIDTGLLFKYIQNSTGRGTTPVNPVGQKMRQFVVTPYAKAQVGPVAVEGQIYYLTGRLKLEDDYNIGVPETSARVDMWSAYLSATADFGIAYAGGTFAWMSGDKQETGDKLEGGLTGGLDWNPCLIMFNSERNYWVGPIAAYDGKANGAPMSNAFFAQLRAGVKPIDKLDMMASLSWAKMHISDARSLGMQSGRDYGWEVDVTGTYKITNNLSYMLGGGYWIVGKYYEGMGAPGYKVKNDFLVINKLTLTF